MTSLRDSILKTLIYFDLFDYPLNLLEIWKWLGTKASLNEVKKELDQLKEKVYCQDGFYFLSGRSELIQIRQERYNLSEIKFKRAGKFIKLLRYIPFIKTVFVCNRLGYSNIHADSDVDLAVIVSKNRLWLARLLAVGLFNFLKVRPKQTLRSEAIDLSFFISEDNLNLENLVKEEAFVFPYWLSQFVPVFDRGKTKQFFQANRWLEKYLPNFLPYDLNLRRRVQDSLFSKLVRSVISLLTDYDYLEKLSERYQMKIMPPQLKRQINQSREVIINQQMLKFHQGNHWQELKVSLEKKMVSL